jgi:hypothetical protein
MRAPGHGQGLYAGLLVKLVLMRMSGEGLQRLCSVTKSASEGSQCKKYPADVLHTVVADKVDLNANARNVSGSDKID